MAAQVEKKKVEDVMGCYENIRESLEGLKEIIMISLPEQDFYHQAALENLEALNDNIIEMLKLTNSPREIRMKLRELEFDEDEEKAEEAEID